MYTSSLEIGWYVSSVNGSIKGMVGGVFNDTNRYLYMYRFLGCFTKLLNDDVILFNLCFHFSDLMNPIRVI